jgi:hypothetical protein
MAERIRLDLLRLKLGKLLKAVLQLKVEGAESGDRGVFG